VRAAGLAEILPRALEIVEDVRLRGDAALFELAERFDGARPESLRVPPEAIERATVDERTLEALRESIRAVRAFHERQRPEDFRYSTYPGVEAERRFVPHD